MTRRDIQLGRELRAILATLGLRPLPVVGRIGGIPVLSDPRIPAHEARFVQDGELVGEITELQEPDSRG